MKARMCCVFAIATGLSFPWLIGEAAADDGWCGEAAWFEGGGLTASGDVNAADTLSAAHPGLPFGTRVKVDNLGNGRSVVVRVNDRGSFARGRVILVSRAAAEELGMIDDGTARVRLSVLVGDQARTGRCGDADDIAAEQPAPEPLAVRPTTVSELPEEAISDEAPTVEATETLGPPADEAPTATSPTVAARFAVAFQPETWQQAELAKVIAAFAPRLAALQRSGRPRAVIPWPAHDGMTPIRLTPTLIAYAWSSEPSLPDPVGFERVAAATHLSQLMQ